MVQPMLHGASPASPCCRLLHLLHFASTRHTLCLPRTANDTSLLPATYPLQVLCECRALKTEAELRIMRYACQVASQAHVAVMRVRHHAAIPLLWWVGGRSLACTGQLLRCG